MNSAENLRKHFEEGIELRRKMAETMPAEIAKAGEALAAALKAGRKVLSCGNGGSAADSQHFAAELLNRFERERLDRSELRLRAVREVTADPGDQINRHRRSTSPF